MHSKPKKSLGQVFLVDKNIQRKIIESCGFKSQDTVLEIGAGKGELTLFIAGLVKKLVALELDHNLFKILKENLRNFSNVEVFNQDILKFNLQEYFQNEKIKVIGNIPYYITTPIIEHLLKYRKNILEIFLTLQKDVAKRIVSACGEKTYGAFSCFVQYYTLPQILFEIKRNSFFPVPKVDSCFVRFLVREKPAVEVKNEELLFDLVKQAFQKRRKTLKNALKDFIPIEKIEEFLRLRNKSSNIRPEELALEEFGFLSNLLSS